MVSNNKNAMELSQQPWTASPLAVLVDINELVPKRPTKIRTGCSAEWSPPMASSPLYDESPYAEDAGAENVSSLDDYLKHMVLEEAREAWHEECRKRWAGEITQPMSSVFRRDEAAGEEALGGQGEEVHAFAESVQLTARLRGGGIEAEGEGYDVAPFVTLDLSEPAEVEEEANDAASFVTLDISEPPPYGTAVFAAATAMRPLLNRVGWFFNSARARCHRFAIQLRRKARIALGDYAYYEADNDFYMLGF